MPSFNVHEYSRLLGSMRATGRPFRTFTDGTAPGLILRLDVDYDLEWASQLAAINRDLAVEATFFVQVGSPLYNPFDPSGRIALRSIVESGQRIGLHYWHEDGGLDTQRLRREFEALHSLVPESGPVVAWHNPDKELARINEEAVKAGFVSAYGDQFFGAGRYISDSNCRNSPDDLITFVSNSSASVVQVLLHPIVWRIGGPDMETILRGAFQAKVEQLSNSFSQNSIWRDKLAAIHKSAPSRTGEGHQ